ncbi:DNA repair protein RecO [Pseudodesulfovibrio sp.]|uniref:DNA repair protein RecO n=1 Tax=unclassified Pseudodesulfovibrio TaxID=2661612 RepID=UPI003B007E36
MTTTEKALVLKVGCFKEADCWVRLLTPSRGIFNGFAFGGLRSRRRFVGCLDPLSLVLFTIGSGKRSDYIILEEGSLLSNFSGIRSDSCRTGMAVNCVKFVESVGFDPGDAQPVYDLLLETLDMLDSGEGSPDFVPWLFRAKLAFLLGFQPDFLSCGRCGESVKAETGYRFVIERGHVVCPTCLSGGKPLEGLAHPLSSGALRALDWVQHSRPAHWASVSMDADVRRQVSRLIELFVAYHLGLSWENGVFKKV